jgi:hypothetical protein
MQCDLSVVVARPDSAAKLVDCLAALARSCEDVAAEILVVQSFDLAPVLWDEDGVRVRTVQLDGEALVPQLWAAGIRETEGRSVALTLAACEVSPGWARAMLDALNDGAAGVAGPIECADEVSLVDRAIYYLRYSAFLPSRVRDADVAGEIPGDNAAYRGSELRAQADLLQEGFWEVLFHRVVRRNGGRLCTRRAATACFTGRVAMTDALRHRVAHGRHFGAWRVATRQRRAWEITAAAPFVPAVLAARAAVRVAASPGDRWRYVAALPIILVIASAWAAGEVLGAWRGANLPRVPPLGDPAVTRAGGNPQ